VNRPGKAGNSQKALIALSKSGGDEVAFIEIRLSIVARVVEEEPARGRADSSSIERDAPRFVSP
jgi:hypothetical protein